MSVYCNLYYGLYYGGNHVCSDTVLKQLKSIQYLLPC